MNILQQTILKMSHPISLAFFDDKYMSNLCELRHRNKFLKKIRKFISQERQITMRFFNKI